MNEIRKLPAVEQRVETGLVQFGDDWPGMFIRGDNAVGYASSLRFAASYLSEGNEVAKTIMEALASELETCRLWAEEAQEHRKQFPSKHI